MKVGWWKLAWRVKLVTEHKPGVLTENELACIERDVQASVGESGYGYTRRSGSQRRCRPRS